GVSGHIDQKVAEYPVHQPWRQISVLPPIQKTESQFQFVNSVRAGFIYTGRLAGRTDEDAREQIGQGRMIQPITDKTLEQVRTPQKGAIGRYRSAKRDMIASACSGVPAINHEFLGSQPVQSRFLVECSGI